MRRVTRGPIVILTYDPDFRGFWLADYFPELVALDGHSRPIAHLRVRPPPLDRMPKIVEQRPDLREQPRPVRIELNPMMPPLEQ